MTWIELTVVAFAAWVVAALAVGHALGRVFRRLDAAAADAEAGRRVVRPLR